MFSLLPTIISVSHLLLLNVAAHQKQSILLLLVGPLQLIKEHIVATRSCSGRLTVLSRDEQVAQGFLSDALKQQI